MTVVGLMQIFFYLFVLMLLVVPLGGYMARVYEGEPCGVNQVFGWLENGIYRVCGIDVDEGMTWKRYLISMLALNMFGILALYFLLNIQSALPYNPEGMASISGDLAFNTAISFITNTNWQAYSGESTMSYFTQMVGLTVANFVSAASGMSLLIALIRGLVRFESHDLGNFWVDTVRGILYILLPLSIILAILLAGQGVIQNLKPYEHATLIQPVSYQQVVTDAENKLKTETIVTNEQVLPMGPVASQVAIKQLGTNGGGFFNTNSAHPYENPTAISNFLEMLAILLIPAAFCYTFGVLVKDRRQGFALLITMLIVFIPFVLFTTAVEQMGNPALSKMGVQSIGNMEGKETRFGITNSALWTTATTAASNGSVNSMLDSYMPLAGFAPLWLMHLGEVIFGGVGSGLYGMLMLVIIAVFVSGLMVGRTPEYLGKKIEPYEMKMASFAVLVMPLTVLIATALAVVTDMGIASISNPGAHGFSEILYAFTSMGNNNGSAFAGLNANTPYYNIMGGMVMLISRYWLAIPVIALAGSLAQKKKIPTTVGTLATHTPLFIMLLIAVTMLIGALSFLPALALGPIVESLTLWGQYGG